VIIVLGVIVVAALVFNVALLLVFPRGAWDREAQGMARSMWLGIVGLVVVIVVALAGLGAVLTLWPVGLALVVLSALAYAAGEWRARRHERQDLEARLRELESRGSLPPWAAGIRARERRP